MLPDAQRLFRRLIFLKETCVYKKYGKEVESEVIYLSFDFLLARADLLLFWNWNSMVLSVEYALCKPSCPYVVLKAVWNVISLTS